MVGWAAMLTNQPEISVSTDNWRFVRALPIRMKRYDMFVTVDDTIRILYSGGNPLNGRQKIEAAFSPDGTPEIPAVICYEDIYIRDHWDSLTTFPWWYAQSPDIDQQIAWIRQVIPAIGQDWMVLPTCPSRLYRLNHFIDPQQDGAYIMDRLSGEKEQLRPPVIGGWETFEHGNSGHVPYMAQTKAEVNSAMPLPPRFSRDKFIKEGHTDLAQRLLAEFGKERFAFDYASTPLWSCYSLWGFEGMMTMIADHPDLVQHACDRFLEYKLSSIQRAAALGADCIWIEDSLTDLISPRAYERLNLPYLQKMVAEVHLHGMRSIYYFCGNPAGKLDLLLESGAEALALEESKKGFVIDIAEIVKVVQGRFALFGNLDAIQLLPHANEKTLRDEIRHQINIGRRNNSRFIMSIGSPVTPGTSPEQVRRYCDLVHEEGSR
jgi:hypothetical protein